MEHCLPPLESAGHWGAIRYRPQHLWGVPRGGGGSSAGETDKGGVLQDRARILHPANWHHLEILYKPRQPLCIHPAQWQNSQGAGSPPGTMLRCFFASPTQCLTAHVCFTATGRNTSLQPSVLATNRELNVSAEPVRISLQQLSRFSQLHVALGQEGAKGHVETSSPFLSLL